MTQPRQFEKVKIISDGTGQGTKVTVDGKQLAVRALMITIDGPRKKADVVLHIHGVDIEYEGPALCVESIEGTMTKIYAARTCANCGAITEVYGDNDFWCIECKSFEYVKVDPSIGTVIGVVTLDPLATNDKEEST